MNDTRHEVSDKMLRMLSEVAYKQDDFGMEKYKEPLNHMRNYDWLQMLLEELADGMKYLQCEMERKAYVIALLRVARRQETVEGMKDYIDVVLDIMTVEGTGK